MNGRFIRRSYNKLYTEEDLKSHSSIAAVIKDEHGNILMQDHVKLDVWMMPAGKVKDGQTPEIALKEEVYEETGLTVISYKLLGDKLFKYIKNDIPIDTYIYLFEVTEYTGTLENKEPGKHRSVMFMSLENIKKITNLSDITKMWLDLCTA